MWWHQTGRSAELGLMHNPNDNEAWNMHHLNFVTESHNVGLELSADGSNSYGKHGYSM